MISIILNAAKAAKVSGTLLLAICTHESGLKNVTVPHDGGSPTYGVCQVKLGTARQLGFTGTVLELLQPEVNAKYAARYLAYQQSRYGDFNWCKLSAAYNSGSYNASQKMPGHPRNLKYVHNVQKQLPVEFHRKMVCAQ